MRKITEDLVLCKFDGINTTNVYVGGFAYLHPALLRWRKEENDYMGDYEVLKLSEIVEQIGKNNVITIFIDEPMRGYILQYGNYGDEWYEIGTTCGYA